MFLCSTDRTLTSSDTSPHSEAGLAMGSALPALKRRALFMMSTSFGWNCHACRLMASLRKCVSSMDTTTAPSSTN